MDASKQAAGQVVAVKKLIVAALSLFLVVTQFFALTAVLQESARPICSSHIECRSGEYCSPEGGEDSRCLGCPKVQDEDKVATCAGVLSGYGLQAWDDIDHTTFDFSDPNFEGHSIEEEPCDEDPSSTACLVSCMALQHCSATDVMPDKCDYLVRNSRQMVGPRVLLIVFLALLFTVPICEDMDSARVEEAVLDHRLKDMSLCEMLPARALRLGLRARRFVLPWWAALVAAAVIITSTISAKDIMRSPSPSFR